jgi:hypothetical protein
MNAPTFAEAAPILERNGFQPLPISLPRAGDRGAGKRPPASLRGWTNPRPAAELVPRYGRCGVGLLARTTPGVDIDVRHAELADAIGRALAAAIGEAPVRYGAAPKRLLLCRTAEPFKKLATRDFRLPGDEPGDKPHKVEVLGDGQQFVAFGIHPATGLPYFWPFDSPLDLERGDLPELTAAAAAGVVAKAEAILGRAGTVVLASRAGQARPRGRPAPGPAPRPVKDAAEARLALAALRSIDPAPLDYDTWVRVAYGLKAALGEPGASVFAAWSAGSAKDVPTTTATTWDSVKPSRCGWRFLDRLAGEINDG